MCTKVGLCLILICCHGSDEDRAEIIGRRGSGRTLGHANSLVLARILEGDRDSTLVNSDRAGLDFISSQARNRHVRPLL